MSAHDADTDRLLTEWRDAALAVGGLRRTIAGLVDEWALADAARLGRDIAALVPDAPRPKQARVPVRGYAAEAEARIGRFIEATDAAAFTGRYRGREVEVNGCIGNARSLRAALEIVALHVAPRIEVEALGLREMAEGSGALLARQTPDLIRALEDARDAGVMPSDIDALRGQRTLTPGIIRIATMVHEGVPLEFAVAMFGSDE